MLQSRATANTGKLGNTNKPLLESMKTNVWPCWLGTATGLPRAPGDPAQVRHGCEHSGEPQHVGRGRALGPAGRPGRVWTRATYSRQQLFCVPSAFQDGSKATTGPQGQGGGPPRRPASQGGPHTLYNQTTVCQPASASSWIGSPDGPTRICCRRRRPSPLLSVGSPFFIRAPCTPRPCPGL